MFTKKQPRSRGIQNVSRVPILSISNTKLQMQDQWQLIIVGLILKDMF